MIRERKDRCSFTIWQILILIAPSVSFENAKGVISNRGFGVEYVVRVFVIIILIEIAF